MVVLYECTKFERVYICSDLAKIHQYSSGFFVSRSTSTSQRAPWIFAESTHIGFNSFLEQVIIATALQATWFDEIIEKSKKGYN